jgi:cation diffusion facilitator CzcD-associated flavoprotein CzcO
MPSRLGSGGDNTMNAGSDAFAAANKDLDYDVLIVGAGLSGIYSLHRMRQLGLRVKVLEAGPAEGGTWFW